jgi:hypothetical protein
MARFALRGGMGFIEIPHSWLCAHDLIAVAETELEDPNDSMCDKIKREEYLILKTRYPGVSRGDIVDSEIFSKMKGSAKFPWVLMSPLVYGYEDYKKMVMDEDKGGRRGKCWRACGINSSMGKE